MKLNGTHTYDASLEHVWRLINDPEVLAKATPGLRDLEQIEEDRFNAVFEIKIGPVNGRFNGTLEVAEKVPPERYTLVVNVQSKVGNVATEAQISLQEVDGGTEVSFQGDVRVTGTLAGLGQRLFSGVARTTTNQFFDGLGAAIAQSTG